jgi:hypothetical protein
MKDQFSSFKTNTTTSTSSSAGQKLHHTTTNFVELIATFYNINNQTLGNKNTFTEPTTLQPGQAAPFTVYLIPKDMPLNQINSVKYGDRSNTNLKFEDGRCLISCFVDADVYPYIYLLYMTPKKSCRS